MQITVKNTTNRPKSKSPHRFWGIRCNNNFCDANCGYNSATRVTGTATSGTTTSLTSAALVGISSMIGAKMIVTDGTNKSYWRRVLTHNTGTGVITFNALPAAIDNTSDFVLDCFKSRTACEGFSNQTKFDGYDEKARERAYQSKYGLRGGAVPNANDMSAWSVIADRTNPIAADSSPIALVYGTARISGKLLGRQYAGFGGYGADHRIYGFMEGEISAIQYCIINGVEIDRTKASAYSEKLGVAGQILQQSDFGAAGTYLWYHTAKYWPRTVIIGIRTAWTSAKQGTTPVNAATDGAFLPYPFAEESGGSNDTVEIVVNGLKVQRYNADGTLNGAKVFSRNPVWCMLDYMLFRAAEPYSTSDIDWSVAYTSATLCDTLGYTLNMKLTEQMTDDEILTKMRNACRAYFTYPSGKIAINIEHLWSGAVAHSFDDKTNGKALGNMEPLSIKPYKRTRDSIYNKIIVKYIDEQERENMAALSADIAIGAGTINYKWRQGTLAASGTIYIGALAVTYSGSTHNADGTGTLTGCSGVTEAFDAGYPIFQGVQTFPERTAIIQDEAHQQAIGQVNVLEIDGSMIGTYKQALAIATYHLKKSIYSNQYVKWRGFRPALGLTVGDVIAFTFGKRGWVDWQFRIIAMSEGNDNKIDFDAEKYDEACYPELIGNPAPPQASVIPSPFATPSHVTGVTLAENGYVGQDGTFIPNLTVTYTLPSEKRFWEDAAVHVKIGSGDYTYYGNDSSGGAGYLIDGAKAGFKKGDTVYVKAISINIAGVPADSATAPTASRTIAASAITLSTPSGLTLEGGGTTWNGRKFAVSWAPMGTGDLDPSYVTNEVIITTGGVDRIAFYTKDNRWEYIYGDGIAAALDSHIVAANGAVTIKVRRTSALVSDSAQATLSITNSAPTNPQNAVVQGIQRGATLSWDKNTETDFKEYQIRTKVTAGGTFGSWIPIVENNYTRMLTAAEVTASGETAAIYFEVKAIDLYGNASSATAANVAAIGYGVKAADIDNFAVTATKRNDKAVIISGDTWTDNSPSAGYVAWNAHTLIYNGASYSITGSNTNLKYIYWIGGTTYQTSNTNPVLSDGQFLIAVNISGAHDLAWNSIANQVIGSAYIQDGSITTVKIGDAQITTAKIGDAQITSAKIDSLRSINVQAGSIITKGSYLTSAPSAGATTLYVKDTTDFPASGSGWIIDTTNDRGAISWTGKTATTLTGCSGVLAHNSGATIVPAGKCMVIDAATNEMRFFGDRGDGTVGELASIGAVPVGVDVANAIFGSYAAGSSRFGVIGYSYSQNAILGYSVQAAGIYGDSKNNYGGVFRGDSKGQVFFFPNGSPSQPSHSADKGAIVVNDVPQMYINTDSGTKWKILGPLLVKEEIITGSAVSSKTITGLSGLAHGGYNFEFVIENPSGTPTYVLFYNSDTTPTNYLNAVHYGGTSHSSSYENNANFAGISGAGTIVITGVITVTQSNVVISSYKAVRWVSGVETYVVDFMHRKIASYADLTQVIISVSGGGSNIGIGSRFRFWRRV